MLIIFEKQLGEKAKKPKKQTVKNFWDVEIQKTIEERNKYEFNSAHYNLLDDEIKRLYEERKKNMPQKRDFPCKEIITTWGVITAACIAGAVNIRDQNVRLRGQDMQKEVAYLSWKHNLELDSCDRMVFNQSQKIK